MATTTVYFLLSGALLGGAGLYVRRRGRRWRRRLAVAMWGPAGLLLAAGGYSFWYHHRPLPASARELLFEGVTYTREARRDPRAMVIHVVEIDLDAPGIGFVVTPANPTAGRRLAGQTVSQFAAACGVQIAVNGGGFRPWHAKGPLSYYPHVGDPVDPTGLVVSKGQAYSPVDPARPAVHITEDNRVSLGQPLPGAYNAVAGVSMIVEDGRPAAGLRKGGSLHPRTAVGIDRTGRRLMLVVVDGRQPNYSEGVNLSELAEILLQRGAHDAINMDGGGSSTLVRQGPDGRPVVLNSPIHGRVPPGRERPVATHLGVFAAPLRRPRPR